MFERGFWSSEMHLSLCENVVIYHFCHLVAPCLVILQKNEFGRKVFSTADSQRYCGNCEEADVTCLLFL